MKTKFPEYYRIHKDNLLDHFEDCIFVFDACALLDIYRLKKELTDDVFKVLEHLKEQIRVPYHVAEEYTKNIHSVLNSQLQSIQKSRDGFKSFVKTFESKRSHPYLSKDTTDLIAKLEEQVEKDIKSQEDYIKEQLLYGEYQNKLSDLLDGKVLKPFTADEIDAIKKEGETRYENKIPPGFKDADKSDNRYGDLINWKEILRFAKESGKHIIIVSSEIKEDWVTKEQGQVVGLRYELIREFYREVAKASQYVHFLSLDRFLEFAREKDDQVVTKETVQQVKDYVVLPHVDATRWRDAVSKVSIPVSMESYQRMLDSWRPIIESRQQFTPEWIEALEKMRKAYTISEPFTVNALNKKSMETDASEDEMLKKTDATKEIGDNSEVDKKLKDTD